MAVNVQTTFRNFETPILAAERIQERVDRLERIFPRITALHVVAEESHRQHHKGTLYHIRIDATVPGGELVVNREKHDRHAHEDFFVALRDAFDAMESQLRSFSDKQNAEVKTHEPPSGETA